MLKKQRWRSHATWTTKRAPRLDWSYPVLHIPQCDWLVTERAFGSHITMDMDSSSLSFKSFPQFQGFGLFPQLGTEGASSHFGIAPAQGMGATSSHVTGEWQYLFFLTLLHANQGHGDQTEDSKCVTDWPIFQCSSHIHPLPLELQRAATTVSFLHPTFHINLIPHT